MAIPRWLAELMLFGLAMSMITAGVAVRLKQVAADPTAPAVAAPAGRSSDHRWWHYLGIAVAVFLFLTAILWLSIHVPNWQAIFSGFITVGGTAALAMYIWGERGWIVFGAGVLGALLAAWWLIWPTWINLDLTGWILGLVVMLSVAPKYVRLLVAVELAIIVYDVRSVFFSDAMITSVTKNIGTPGLLMVPEKLELHGYIQAGLGLGDVAIPGVMVVTAATLVAHGIGRRLHWGGLAGYVADYAITVLVGDYFKSAQPATLYLIPATMLGIGLVAWREGVWGDIWNRQSVPLKQATRPLA